MLQLVQQSTSGDCQKLPDFISLDGLPAMLVVPRGGQQSSGATEDGVLAFSWAKVFSLAFQQLPRKCGCRCQDGKNSINGVQA